MRALVVAAIAASVAACSSGGPSVSFKERPKEFFSEAQYGAASPRVVDRGPVPKGGGRAMVGKPYRVAGKTYIPRDNPDYSASGLASWYGAAFHGRLTANGEVYDVNALTAAHPTLPLPSYARVTNSKNGRSVIVRINDRGPFAHDRIIDVSSRVADMLDFKGDGTAKVRVDYMGPAQMDGLDQKMLLASYREGGNPGRERFANTFMVAQAPLPRQRPVVVNAFQSGGAFDQPMTLAPAPASGDAYDDPLAPLIMRTSFASGYAAAPGRTKAQRAANALAGGTEDDLQAALERAAARKAQQLGATAPGVVVMQLGTFANGDNAARIAREFARFGRTEAIADANGGQALTVVRVTLNPSASAADVTKAAADTGLRGVFTLD